MLGTYEMTYCCECKSDGLFRGKSTRKRRKLPYHSLSSWVDMNEIKVHKIKRNCHIREFQIGELARLRNAPWNNS